MATLDKKNLKFLSGTSASLSALTKSTPGAFYVTTDTCEMYLGVDENSAPKPLNRYVDVQEDWATISQLPITEVKQGKIYYAKSENILCTFNGTQWVQINADTNTSLRDASFSKGIITDEEEDNAKVTYTLTLTQKHKNNEQVQGGDVTANLVITASDIEQLVPDINVGVDVSREDESNFTISTTGIGSDESTIAKIKVVDGLSIDTPAENDIDKSDIIISGTTYKLQADQNATVVLQNSREERTLVNFSDDDTWIKVESVASQFDEEGQPTAWNGIKISHTGPSEGDDISLTDSDESGNISKENRTFTAITSIQADNTGHITGAKKTTFTVPSSKFILEVEEDSVSIDNNESTEDYTTYIALKDKNSDERLSTVQIKTAHTITIDNESSIIKNGDFIGNFYSAEKINALLKGLNALTYKGIVNCSIADSFDGEIEEAKPLPTTNVSLGDTYKVAKAFGVYAVGDLLIANRSDNVIEEDSDGYIPTDKIQWDHISTGDDTDTTYTLKALNNAIIIEDSPASVQQRIDVAGDTWIDVELKQTTNQSVTKNEFNITHNPVTTTDNSGTPTSVDTNDSGSLLAITSIDYDGAGHLTNVTYTDYTLPADDKIEVEGGAKPSVTITDGDSGVLKGQINFSKDYGLEVSGVVEDDKKTLTVTYEHAEINQSENKDEKSTDIPLDGTGTFKVVYDLQKDGYGHITEWKTKDIVINKETTYTLDGPIQTANTNNLIYGLKNSESSAYDSSIELESNTLTYTLLPADADKKTKASIDLLWGSFN